MTTARSLDSLIKNGCSRDEIARKVREDPVAAARLITTNTEESDNDDPREV